MKDKRAASICVYVYVFMMYVSVYACMHLCASACILCAFLYIWRDKNTVRQERAQTQIDILLQNIGKHNTSISIHLQVILEARPT
jgi:hypothetical protein